MTADGLYKKTHLRSPGCAKIIYLHGFNSACNPEDIKVQTLHREFGKDNFLGISYDSFAEHASIQAHIGRCVQELKGQDLCLIGTSLGGYHALEIGRKMGLPAIALNPVMNPVSAMVPMEDFEFTNFVTRETRRLDKAAVSSYAGLAIDEDPAAYQVLPLLLLNMQDPYVDNDITAERYSRLRIKEFQSYCHRFSNIESAMPSIRDYVHHNGYIDHLD